MHRTKTVLLLLLAIAIIFSGCKNEPKESSSSESSSSRSIKSFNVTGAKALIVVPTTSQGTKDASRSSDSMNHFCKITENGEIEEVFAFDNGGNQIRKVPTRVFDAGKYVILNTNEGEVYLVSKENGDAYDMSSVGCPEIMRNNLGYDTAGRQSVFTDNVNRIYFIKNGRVAMVDVSNPNNITLEFITPDTYNISSVNEFAVDVKGNVLFSCDSPQFVESFYARKTNGSIEKISIFRCMLFTGYDGSIYIQMTGASSETDTRMLKKVSIDESYVINYSNCNSTGLGTWYSGGYNWLYLKNKIIVIGNSGGQSDGVESVMYDAISGNNYYNVRSFLNTPEIADIQPGVKCYFVAKADGSLLKVDSDENNYEVILSAGDYDIKKIVSANDNKISFSGIRYFDGKKILGTVDVDTKTVSIVNDSLSDDIIVLRKLN